MTLSQPSHEYARREAVFRPSPVRAVFELAMSPEVISLAGGNPLTEALPHAELGELSAQLLRDNGAEILQYGSGAGTVTAREKSVQLMEWGGARYDVDEIQMAPGSQAGLDALTKVLCDPGDVIIAEGPTYVGALSTFSAYEVQVEQVPVDAEGIDPEAVAQRIDELQAQGKRVRFVYTISVYQNPTGVSLTRVRAERLIEVCAARGVWVVEDDAYGLLGFDTFRDDTACTSVTPHRPDMLAAIDKKHVVHLGSYSKIFSPGSRVGWIGAPRELRARLQIALESVSLNPAVLSQEIVTHYVGTPLWATTLATQLAHYKERARATEKALATYLPNATWTHPEGGFFVWVTLPETCPIADPFHAALDNNVVIVPGRAGYAQELPEGTPDREFRIAFSGTTPEAITEGVKRLSILNG